MMVKKESFKSVYSELKTMFKKHHAELNSNLGVELNINYDLYSTLEHMNKLVTLVARDENKKPTGFLVALVNEHPHHRGEMVINVDSFHVLGDQRRTGVADAMFTALQQYAESVDTTFILATVKAYNEASKFLEKIGFDLHEKVYIRKL